MRSARTLFNPPAGKDAGVLLVGEEADDQHAGEDDRERPQREEERAAGDVDELAAVPGRVDAAEHRDRVGDRDRDDVEQQRDRQRLEDEPRHRPAADEALAEVGRLEPERRRARPAGARGLEPHRRHLVQPPAVLHDERLIKPVTLVVILPHRLALGGTHAELLADQARPHPARRHPDDEEHQRGDPEQRGHDQQQSAEDVAEHGEEG
jgi:hypothetical protein